MAIGGSRTRWMPLMALLVVLATAAALAVGFGRVNLAGAQDGGTPAADEGRPAHIHSGSCNDTAEDALGDVVQPLTNVAPPAGAPAGGQDDAASPVETSVTTVPVALADILAEDHAVNVHLSVEEAAVYIACGEVGGTLADADGSLTIGLREQDGSGFVGVAYLAPSLDDPAQTTVSLFVAEGLAGGGDGAAADDEGAAEEETPAADEEDGATEEAGSGDTGGETTVSMVDFAFEPAEITVAVGDTVTWTNDGERPHTATAQDRDALQSGTVDPGADVSQSFDEAGTYEYFCEFHEDMNGTIVVE